MVPVYFQFFAYPQLQATRAVSGRSVPIIACIAEGAGAIIRFFGPESMGGRGDIGAKIDAEVARTGQSDDEIGRKVYILHHASRDGICDLESKDILPYRRETYSDSWSSCNVWPWIFPAKGMAYLS